MTILHIYPYSPTCPSKKSGTPIQFKIIFLKVQE